MVQYAGMAVLEVDGVEFEITDLNVTKQTGRKLVKTMNSGRSCTWLLLKALRPGSCQVTAALPIDGSEIDWAGISVMRKSRYIRLIKKISVRLTFLVALLPKYARNTRVDNEAVIDIQMNALKEVKEYCVYLGGAVFCFLFVCLTLAIR